MEGPISSLSPEQTKQGFAMQRGIYVRGALLCYFQVSNQPVEGCGKVVV